jgi:hypothetical protein
MGVKALVLTVLAVLFRPGTFWKELKRDDQGVNALKDYAVPVIAVVQLCKFPLVGVPRTAMLFSLVTFIVDVSVIYLLAGGIMRLFDRQQKENVQDAVLTILCYALTPVWLFELLYFTGGWSWFFAAAALSYALVIGRMGFAVMLDAAGAGRTEGFAGKAGLLIIMTEIAAFLVIRGLLRFFTIP